MRLTAPQYDLLSALAGGATLKAHRELDGDKKHVLHRLDGSTEPVPAALVESLRERGLIQSNFKFPAATYVLTEDALRLISSQ